MGKRYYCEYCDKSMVSSPALIKTHNQGLLHQRLVTEHYQKFKDPETILAEESAKKPCNRFITGHCQFGSICRYSHYTPEELNQLRFYVAEKNQISESSSQPCMQELYSKLQKQNQSNNDNMDTTVLYDSNGITHTLPWKYNPLFEAYEDSLPPSLKKIKIEDFLNANITTWG